MQERIFVGLGANLGDAAASLGQARALLSSEPKLKVVAASRIYQTEPQGLRDQPWFLNQVLELAVAESYTPNSLLTFLQSLETSLGRKRNGPRNGPRVIDLDLLLFGEREQLDPACTLPHPRMLERAFVLQPLAEIAPQLMIRGLSVVMHLSKLNYRLEGLSIFQPD